MATTTVQQSQAPDALGLDHLVPVPRSASSSASARAPAPSPADERHAPVPFAVPVADHGPGTTTSPPRSGHRLSEAAYQTAMTPTAKFAVMTLIISINIVQFTSNCFTIGGGLTLSAALGRPTGSGKANWMAASYPLTQGAFVLITGRLGSIYGHNRLVVLGSLVFAVFSLANAFSASYDSFIAMRALTGIGGGMFMPNAAATITTMTPPGRSRNVALAFFAAGPPIGGMIGFLLAGVFTEMAAWKWFFVLMTVPSAVFAGLLAYLFPREVPVDKNGKIDVVGAVLGLGALILFNVAWNQAPALGWSEPSVIACLVVSIAFLAGFVVWEKSYAAEPVMPLGVFRRPTFAALIVVVLLTYMGFGICLWYTVLWQQILRDVSVLQTGVNFLPFGLTSVVSVSLAAWLVPRVAAEWILGAGVATVVVSNAILATMPVRQTYWAQVFPSTLIFSFCPDFVYLAAQLIACNSVGRRHQGVASSLVGTLNLYGNSLGLGFAGTIESQVARGEDVADLVSGYRAALYFGSGLAVVGLVLDFAFVRMPKDDRDGWDEEMEEMEGQDRDGHGLAASATATAVDRP